MKVIHLSRTTRTDTCTLGVITLPAILPGTHGKQLFSLEPPVREQKPRTIPAGTYVVKVQRMKGQAQPHLRLIAVAGFSNVKIEVGNFPQDTRGCVLVGLSISGESLLESKKAFALLLESLGDASEFTLIVSDVSQTKTQ